MRYARDMLCVARRGMRFARDMPRVARRGMGFARDMPRIARRGMDFARGENKTLLFKIRLWWCGQADFCCFLQPPPHQQSSPKSFYFIY